MSSIFQHVVRAAGGGIVKFNVGTGAPVSPVRSQHLLLDSAGAVYAATTGTPVSWQGGVPFLANGRVLINQSSVVARIEPGPVPIAANGGVAVGDPITSYNHGVGYAATGAIAAAPAAAPVNLWNVTNILGYGGGLGTTITASGLTNNNFSPPPGTNFASWQGPPANGKTHRLRIEPVGGADGEFTIVGVDTFTTLGTLKLTIGSTTTVNVNIPLGDTGWLIRTSLEASPPGNGGSWLAETYEV